MNSANLFVAFWYKKQSGVRHYFGLHRMNDSLLNENTRLRQQLSKQTDQDNARFVGVDTQLFRARCNRSDLVQ